MDKWEMKQLTDVRDKDIYSVEGEKIGTVRDIYYDETSRTPEWVGIGTGFLGLKERIVPVDNLTSEGDHLTEPFTKDMVKNEPDFDIEDGHLMSEHESQLYSYFGITGHTEHNVKMLRYGDNYDFDR